MSIFYQWLKARAYASLLLFLFPAAAGSSAQVVASLSQVKTVYVDQFAEGAEAEPLRQSLIKRLAASGRYQVMDNAAGADAIVKGSGEIWVKGYMAINVRTPESNRQPILGGYLSVELLSRDGEPLWSYLVTPSRFVWKRVRDDLANSMVREMMSEGEKAHGQVGAAAPASSTQKLATTELVGAGATFPAPLYRKWFASFQKLHPEIRIQYQEVGSEAGVAKLQQGTVDFAASELPEPVDAAKDVKIRRIASVLGAVVPAYHLEGVDRDLRFTPDVLAAIYLGKIRRWNDPVIRKLNKDVDLPDSEIIVIHRSDGSGTTYAFSDFLSTTSADWKRSVGTGTKLRWPAGVGVEGNESVATRILETPNALGYVELVFAIQHHLSFGSVRNQAGQFVQADLDTLAEAARSAAGTKAPGSPASILNAPGRNAYPIALYTWLLTSNAEEDEPKQKAITSLFTWILQEGQRECSSLGYAPLPLEVVDSQQRVLNAK